MPIDVFSHDQEVEKISLSGVAVGIVINNQDPDGLGRVKVKFPWRSGQDESQWARIATLMAGNQMGTFFLPEVDDEVLVAFEFGDLRRPYVIGSLWNGKDKPPENNSNGQNNVRLIRSRSGHEIIFDDKSAGEQLTIKTKAGQIISLDDTASQEKIEIKDKSGSNMIVISESFIEIRCNSQLNILSRAVVEIAAASVLIKAGADLVLKGGKVSIDGTSVFINGMPVN